jgi:hypothetical protein
MANSFFPITDAGALSWAQHFASMITASPVDYGLVAGQASAFTGLVAGFQTWLTACEPTVRNKASTAAKNAARAAMKLSATQLANIINGQPAVSDAQKIALGLTVRGSYSPVPVPADPPALAIVSVIGRTVKIRVHSSATVTRARPAGVTGATVFSYVGTTPPGDLSTWRFQGSTSKAVIDVTFSDTAPAGSAVWLIAFWYNGKGQSGPACSPVPTYLAGGSVSLAA